jgi:hypothetical protein
MLQNHDVSFWKPCLSKQLFHRTVGQERDVVVLESSQFYVKTDVCNNNHQQL